MSKQTNFFIALNVARKSLAKHRAAEAAYEAEVRDWYENGDGRDPEWVTEYDEDGDGHRWNIGGMGHTFPYCIHGSSLWTDYDNICGGCEDSYRLTYLAACDGWAVASTVERRMEWFRSNTEQLPNEILGPLMAWVFEPLSEWS